jgi:ABC-type multidrug transport system fused ATPase/permease subunit
MEGMSNQEAALEAINLLRRFGIRHRWWFLRGMAGTLLAVAMRLAIPWPLKGILELVSGVGTASLLPHDWFTAALLLVAAYIGIAAVLGYAELVQRVCFKGYAVRTVHDMRAAVVDRLLRRPAGSDTADLLTRLIGDSARIKAELSGILVHVSQNALLFIGVCLMFLIVAPKLSFFFLIGGVFAVWVGYAATRRISAVTRAQRDKESEYAEYVHDILERRTTRNRDPDANDTSGRHDATATQLIATAAWVVQLGLAVITAVALLVAIHEVEHARLQLGDVFLFIAYVLLVHRRMLQVGRQLARGGKLMANVHRIRELFEPADPQGAMSRLGEEFELVSCLSAEDGVRGAGPEGSVPVVIRRGTATAVLDLGPVLGSPLFRVFATAGEDDTVLRSATGHIALEEMSASPDIAVIPAHLDLGEHRLGYYIREWSFLDMDDARVLGLPRLVKLAGGSLKKPAAELVPDRNSAQALVLARLIRTPSPPDLWLVEDPVTGLPKRKARRLVKAILRAAGGATLVMVLPRPVALDRFHRVIVVEGGKCVYDGAPQDWIGAEVAAGLPT